MSKTIKNITDEILLDEYYTNPDNLFDLIVTYNLPFMPLVKKLYSLGLIYDINFYLRDLVQKEYIDNNMSMREIERKYGFCLKDIKKIITLFNIQKDNNLIKEHKRNAMISKYGSASVFGTTDVKQKIKETNLERYGTEYGFQSDIVKQKIKETNIVKYGCENPRKSDKVLEKIKETNLERYGTEYGFQSDIVKQKIKETKFINATSKNIFANFNLLIQYGSPNDIRTYFRMHFEGKTIYEVAEVVNLSHSRIGEIVKKYNLQEILNIRAGYSQKETILYNLIRKLVRNKRILRNVKILNSFEVDIYIPSIKIGIEFNGNYWHSTDIKAIDYHQKKSLLAEQKGIMLIHVYEYELDNNIEQLTSYFKNLFSIKKRISAHNCNIDELQQSDVLKLCSQWDIENNNNFNKCYCLKYNDDILQMMLFNNTVMIGTYTKSGYIVLGGISKLVKSYSTRTGNTEIYSTINFNKYSGDGLIAAGFELDSISCPDVITVNDKYVIYGAGFKKFIWKKGV